MNSLDCWDSASAFRALVESVDACVFLVDLDGRHLTVNRAFSRWLGRSLGDIVGRTVFDLWPEDLAERFASDQRRVLSGVRLDQEEQRPRGSEDRRVRTIQVPMYDDQGHIQGVLGLFRDVTNEAHPEEPKPLAQQLEALSRLAGGIAHDFNNLLTALLGNLALLQDAVAASGPLGDVAARMDKLLTRAQGLTAQLLTFTRRDRRLPDTLDLNALVTEVAGILGPTLGPRIRIEVRTCPDLPALLADRSRIHQMILILCLNARDAMPRGGRLLVETGQVTFGDVEASLMAGRRTGTFVRLRVADTSESLAPESRARTFEPSVAAQRTQGSGLGLALVGDLIAQRGGWVECVSTPGQGARFDVYLPPAPTAPQPVLKASRETILVVDREPILLRLAQMLLQNHGYRVLLAETASEAVEQYRQTQGAIDLMLLDESMTTPSRNPLEALRAVAPTLGVVLVVSSALPELPSELRRHVCGYLVKPYKVDQLLRLVQAALSERATLPRLGAPV
jgi:PAS domain S-box-containing protein